MLDFITIDTDNIATGHFSEVDDSQANTGGNGAGGSVLILGPADLVNGNAEKDVATLVRNGQDLVLFGNSPIADMCRTVQKLAPGLAIYAVPTDKDDAALTKPEWEILDPGQPNQSMTDTMYVGWRRYPVALTTTMTAAERVQAYADAINNDVYAQVEVTSTDVDKFTVRALAGGLISNSIWISFNRGGALAGEITPVGFTSPLVIQTVQGAGTPILTNALVAAGDHPSKRWISAWGDTATLAQIETVLLERWHWTDPYKGKCIAHLQTDSLATSQTYGNVGNENLLVTTEDAMELAEPSWIAAAGWAAETYESLAENPGKSTAFRQIDCLSLRPGVAARDAIERDTMLKLGLAEWIVDDFGNVVTGRPATRRTKDGSGAPSDAWDLINTIEQIERFADLMRSELGPFMKGRILVNDDEPNVGGVRVSARVMFARAVLAYKRLQRSEGWLENLKGFIENSVFERDQNYVNRMKVRFAPDLGNPLLQIFSQIQFRKQAVFNV